MEWSVGSLSNTVLQHARHNEMKKLDSQQYDLEGLPDIDVAHGQKGYNAAEDDAICKSLHWWTVAELSHGI